MACTTASQLAQIPGCVSFAAAQQHHPLQVTVVFPLDYMTSKCQAKARSCAKRMRAGSSTNLSGGLFRGIDILQQALQTGVATPGGGAASTTADAFAVPVPAMAQSLSRAAVTALEAAWNLQDAAGSLASREAHSPWETVHPPPSASARSSAPNPTLASCCRQDAWWP